MDAASKITAQDFLDAANEEMAQFKLADIVTGKEKLLSLLLCFCHLLKNMLEFNLFFFIQLADGADGCI